VVAGQEIVHLVDGGEKDGVVWERGTRRRGV